MTGRDGLRFGFLAAALTAACGPAPQAPAAPQPLPAMAAADSALRSHIGASYAEFSAAPGLERYAPAQLPLNEAARARLLRAMSQSAPSWTAEGGGTEALFFVGCAAEACAEAAGIVVIDLAGGDVFAAVRDGEGRDVLIENPRLEALVETTSPADRWADPQAWADEPEQPAP